MSNCGRGRPFCYPPSEATGVFRAATGVAAAPQRGANPHSRRRSWGRSSARTTTNTQRGRPKAWQEYRQVVKRSETPAYCVTNNSNPDGVTEFCRAFGTNTFAGRLSRGFVPLRFTPPPACVLTPLRGLPGSSAAYICTCTQQVVPSSGEEGLGVVAVFLSSSTLSTYLFCFKMSKITFA